MTQQFLYATTQIEEPITVEDNVLTIEEIRGYVPVLCARDWLVAWYGCVC